MTDEIRTDYSRQTAKQRAHATYMIDVGRRIEWDLHNAIDRSGFIPRDWHDIAKATPDRKRIKVTMRIEEDVVRFFRATGTGHLGRMADVLKIFMHARLAGFVRGAETLNHFKHREEVHDGPRPPFGEALELLGERFEDAAPPRQTERIPTWQQVEEMIYQLDRRNKDE